MFGATNSVLGIIVATNIRLSTLWFVESMNISFINLVTNYCIYVCVCVCVSYTTKNRAIQ
jgi:hypothetical protein